MSDLWSWLDGLGQTFLSVLNEAVGYLPSLVGAVFVLIVGWLIGRLARVAVRRISENVNRLMERFFRKGALASVRLSATAAAALGEAAFWIVVFLAVTVAARMSGLTVIAEWLDKLVLHLPNFIIGIAIIVVGYLASLFVGEQAASAAREAKAGQSALIGTLAQSAIFITALIIGLDQVGVDVTFLVALFAVTIGAIAVGFSIAFALGAQNHIGNLIGARSTRRELRPGYVVRIGGEEGTVLEITQTHIVLDAADGRLLIPGRVADISNIAVLSSGEDRESADG